MKIYVVLLAALLILPSAFAVDRYVTFTISSLKDMDLASPEIMITPQSSQYDDKWEFCFDTECQLIIGNLSAGWSMTLGPFNDPSWNVGTWHDAIIRINGDGSNNGAGAADLRMTLAAGTKASRAWRTTRINNAQCPLFPGQTSDITGAQDALYFAGDSNPDAGGNAGYGDVDNCAGSKIEWTTPFQVTQ
jgi:hypothetical protein